MVRRGLLRGWAPAGLGRPAVHGLGSLPGRATEAPRDWAGVQVPTTGPCPGGLANDPAHSGQPARARELAEGRSISWNSPNAHTSEPSGGRSEKLKKS